MLALQSSLRRMLAPRALVHLVCSSFATDHREREGTFYEFCTYYLKPSNVEEFLYNFKKNVHLRTAHSELVGYWSVGFGGRLNTVFHIWKYDSYAQRAAVYKALAKDNDWQERFLIPNLPFIDKQESEITYLVPWCKLGTPPKEVHVLWWVEDADRRAAGRHQAHEDPKVVSAVRESVNYLDTQQNMFLIPWSFSPLK
ncbi:protein NipSnap homolog 3B-like isoform X2 [Rattus rattus]|uniref:protein NipSnap homolog 3B-like isoform X2 n=1 Tax=Rattus rattus TaxID=10117 RepID=UPI0013F348C6|nr:protein NipSnap homolog 3B-like isoform X2 [Rattus rattus]